MTSALIVDQATVVIIILWKYFITISMNGVTVSYLVTEDGKLS